MVEAIWVVAAEAIVEAVEAVTEEVMVVGEMEEEMEAEMGVEMEEEMEEEMVVAMVAVMVGDVANWPETARFGLSVPLQELRGRVLAGSMILLWSISKQLSLGDAHLSTYALSNTHIFKLKCLHLTYPECVLSVNLVERAYTST
jgi:hypothetical protein